MKIPDFSKPSQDCFLTTDMNGIQLKEGDVVASFGYPLNGHEKVVTTFLPVQKYNDELVIPVYPSFLLGWYVRKYCYLILEEKISPVHTELN